MPGLFSEFTPDSLDAWKERATRELKGKPLDSLLWKNPEGIMLEACYTPENSGRIFPVLRYAGKNEWDVYQTIYVQHAEQANREALKALNQGATALEFFLPDEFNMESLPEMLKNIGLLYIETGFNVRFDQVALLAEVLSQVIRLQDTETGIPGFVEPRFNGYPSTAQWNTWLGQLAKASGHLPRFRFLCIDGSYVRRNGGNGLQELTYVLGLTREIGETHPDLLSLPGQIRLSSGGDYFSELCKFRIANYLLLQIAGPSGRSEAFYLMACSNEIWLSALDANTNLLRETGAAMSAVMGGCQGLSLSPYMQGGENPSFAGRISTNIQLVLQHEAGLTLNEDPARGAWYPEYLSFALAEAAWGQLMQMEEAGGILSLIEKGQFTEQICQEAEAVKSAVETRKKFLLGVNQFPAAGPVNSWTGEGFRAAQSFEKLRWEVQQSDTPPTAALWLFGDVAMRNARAGFARNFLGCAGIECRNVLNTDQLTDEQILVLCSSDDEYEDMLNNLPKGKIILLAGQPGEKENAYRSAGITDFIHARSPLLHQLNHILEKVRVTV